MRRFLIAAMLVSSCFAQDVPWSTVEAINHGPVLWVEMDSAIRIQLSVKCNLKTPCLAAPPVDQELRFFEQVGDPEFNDGWQTVHYEIVFPTQQGSERILGTVEHWGREFTYKWKVESWF